MGCQGKAKHLGGVGRWGQGWPEGSQGRDGKGGTWGAQGWRAQRVPEDGGTGLERGLKRCLRMVPMGCPKVGAQERKGCPHGVCVVPGHSVAPGWVLGCPEWAL